jgi:hypothetical protein
MKLITDRARIFLRIEELQSPIFPDLCFETGTGHCKFTADNEVSSKQRAS